MTDPYQTTTVPIGCGTCAAYVPDPKAKGQGICIRRAPFPQVWTCREEDGPPIDEDGNLSRDTIRTILWPGVLETMRCMDYLPNEETRAIMERMASGGTVQ